MPAEISARPRALNLVRLYFLSAALLGLIPLALLLAERSAGGGLLLGYSFTRLASAAGVLVLIGLFAALFAAPLRSAAWKTRLESLPTRLERPPAFAAGLLLSLAGLLLGAYLVTLTPEIEEPFTRGLLDNLQPFALWLGELGALSLILVLALSGRFSWREAWKDNPAFWTALGGFLLLFLAWAWTLRNRFSIDSALTGWNSQGAPILETQALLAGLAGLAVLLVAPLVMRLPGLAGRFSRVDLAAALVIWLLAAALWNTTPLPSSWFVTEPRPPNFERYPNSDALGYDLSAQTLLIGEGVEYKNTPFIPRAMHTLFLFLLHAVGGQDYETVALLQTLVLALIPVLVYLLAARLANRLSGLLAALLLIFREANSIRISDAITVSHARSLMSDLPTALVLIAFVLLSVQWLQDRDRKPWRPLVIGGVLGATVLIRPEAAVQLLPLMALAALVLRSPRRWARGALLVGLGLLLVVGPWVARNYALTGLVYLNTPSFRSELFLQRFRLYETGPEGTAVPTDPAAAAETPLAPASPDEPPGSPEAGPSVARQILDFLATNTSEVAGFTISHFTNSQMQLLLQLPATARGIDSAIALYGHRSLEQFELECCSTLGYIRRLPFWRKWDGALPSQSLVPLAVNVLLIAAGLNLAWKKERWIGLAPLLMGFTHLGINAVVRNSGGRYVLSFDWIAVLYFSIGLALVLDFFLRHFTSGRSPSLEAGRREASATAARQPGHVLRSPAFYGWAAVLLAAGCLLPALESSLPARYPEDVQTRMVASLVTSPLLAESGLKNPQELADFIQNEAIIRVGRGMYPNFYEAGAGEPGSPNPLGPMPFSRIGFYYVGYETIPVLLPFDRPPETFENAADLLVVSCPDGETAAVAVFASPEEPLALYVRDGLPLPPRCPLY